jgi:hypothetical protein
MLQFFSASTHIVNSMRAIRECLEVALEGEQNLDCDLLIIHTSMGHNFKELLNEAHKLSPSAQIAGCTGAGVIGFEGPNQTMKAVSCFQFFNDRIIERGAVMVGFSDPTLKIFGQASHGMKVIREMPFEATKAEKNVIIELNGQPAWKVIANTLGISESTPWPEYGMLAFLANEAPEPLQDAFGEKYYLNVLMDDAETGVLPCNRTVRQGSYF